MSFEYHSSSRNVFNCACLVAAILILRLGIIYGAPLIWLLVAGPPSLALLWYLWVNIQFGMQITESAMCWHSGKENASVALGDIEHVKITTWSDSSDVDVVLKTGDALRVPSQCYPTVSKLKTSLQEYSIVVIDV